MKRYLGDRDPDEAEPPEVEGEEEGAEDVAQRAGQHVPEYVLHGVTCGKMVVCTYTLT